MNYWIFQAKPERFDLRKPGTIEAGKSDDWDATRYRSEMMPGDKVFFWLAGNEDHRGIYGWGELTSEPHPGGSHSDFVAESSP